MDGRDRLMLIDTIRHLDCGAGPKHIDNTRGLLGRRQTLMADQRRGQRATAQGSLQRHPNIHLGAGARQGQPAATVPTHLPGPVAPTNVALHHRLCLHMEYRPVGPRRLWLRAHGQHLSLPGQPVSRQPHHLVRRRGHQHYDRLYCLCAADPPHQLAATPTTAKDPVDHGLWFGILVRPRFFDIFSLAVFGALVLFMIV